MSTDRFAPCPTSPNCVSSYAPADDPMHAIAALPLPNEPAIDALVAALESLPRVEILVRDDGYIHATQRSRIFRFVDDIELRIDRDASVVHVRSASRVGYGDMGVNRERVEELRRILSDSR